MVEKGYFRMVRVYIAIFAFVKEVSFIFEYVKRKEETKLEIFAIVPHLAKGSRGNGSDSKSPDEISWLRLHDKKFNGRISCDQPVSQPVSPSLSPEKRPSLLERSY